MQFLYMATALSSVLGIFILLLTFASAKGAPQEAAGAALAMAFAVLPYVFTRCIQMAGEQSEIKRRHQEIIKTLNARNDADAN